MNFEYFYEQNAGKNVVVTMADGEIFTGKLISYTPEYDNDPDPESIVVGEIELFTNEIKSINKVVGI